MGSLCIVWLKKKKKLNFPLNRFHSNTVLDFKALHLKNREKSKMVLLQNADFAFFKVFFLNFDLRLQYIFHGRLIDLPQKDKKNSRQRID